MTKEELENYVSAMDEKKFRGRQVFKWISRGVDDVKEMTDLSKSLREKLSETAYIGKLNERITQRSKDGTFKYLFGLSDGNAIETVLMKYEYGNSICISSQAGCRMGCTFCASGKNGLARDLTAGEMYDQILQTQNLAGEKINHIVVMGTGEPLDNYDELSRFINIVNDDDSLNMGMRNITVSTAGIVPMIERLANDFPQVNLAVSLHDPRSDERSKVMPINKKYPVDVLMDECRKYTEKTNRRITFEYAVRPGENDDEKTLGLLVRSLSGMLCHVNLIPINNIAASAVSYEDSRKRAIKIAGFLTGSGIPATVRRSLGRDIDAACGQLRASAS